MADNTRKGGVLSFAILSEGKEIPAYYKIYSIRVSKGVNKIGYAQLRIGDGGVATNEGFKISESNDFKPGSKIEIKVGFDDEQKTVFKGIVIKHGLKVSTTSSFLTVECKDESVKMTIGRKNAIFEKKKDSDIINEIIGKYPMSKKVGNTTTKHPEAIQHYCSDWDFVLMRADVNAMVVIVDDGKLTIDKPDLSASEKLTIAYDKNLLSFNAEMDAKSQLKASKSYAWDSAEQKLINSSGKKLGGKIGGDISADDLAKVLALEEFTLQSIAEVPKSALEDWATAALSHSKLSKMKGKLSFYGDSTIKPGDMIKLEGLGKRFDGKVFVGAVEHSVEDGDWITTVHLGLNFEWFTEEADNIYAPETSGLFSPVQGLYVGTVKKIHEDPDGHFRVQIILPTIDEGVGKWARMASFYATNKKGAFFYPEVNDEVVVGFLNDDPLNPVILGKLYSKKNAPPLTPDDKNQFKAIVTNSEMKIQFDDEDKILSIETPGGNKMTFTEKDKAINIEDQNGNKIDMDDKGVTVTAKKDITLKASSGKISLQSKDIELKANMGVKVEGTNIESKAKAKYAAEGSAQTEIKSGGQTVVKGAMVMIN